MNIAQLERDLAAKKAEASALFAKTGLDAQNAKNDKNEPAPRERTKEERDSVQALIDQATAIQARIDGAKGDDRMRDEIAKISANLAVQNTAAPTSTVKELRSMGQQFTDAEAYKSIQKFAANKATNWKSDAIELNATTLETSNTSGGDLIVTDYRPGITPLLFKRLVIADLLASGSTDSNSITYMKETTFTNAAAAVAEGGIKPESTLVFDQVTDLVTKIAHWLPVTDEMLEDVAQIRSYIDARLRLGLDITEEDELLNGSGTAPHLTGLLNRSGLTSATVRSGSTTNAEAIFTAMMAVFNASFVMPTGTVMNPANWQTTQLSKDGDGRYYGPGPFAGPQTQVLWGLPVVVTPSIVANTGFTGAFSSAAQVFRKGGVRVEASNSHSDFFIRNLTAIRAEERLALAVYRPAAFSKITSLT